MFGLNFTTVQPTTLISLSSHVCFDISILFFCRHTLQARHFVRNPFLCSLPFAGLLIVYTLLTGDSHSPLFKIMFYAMSLLADVIFYREQPLKRLGNYFYIVFCLSIIELVLCSMYYILNMVFQFEGNPVLRPISPENIIGTAVFTHLPVLGQIILMPYLIRLWRRHVQYIQIQVFIELTLSTLLAGSGVLYIFPEWMGAAGWIPVFVGNFLSILLLFHAMRKIRLMIHIYRKEQEMFHRHLEDYNAIWKENLRLRKQNHDITGHVQTISLLLQKGNMRDAQKYIHELLEML